MSHSQYRTSLVDDVEAERIRNYLYGATSKSPRRHHYTNLGYSYALKDETKKFTQYRENDFIKYRPITTFYNNIGRQGVYAFVYEDIYSKEPWLKYSSKPKGVCSSLYKPIKPEYLTLPRDYVQNKYYTLPKSWSISSQSHRKSNIINFPEPLSPRVDYKKYSPINLDDYYGYSKYRSRGNGKYEYGAGLVEASRRSARGQRRGSISEYDEDKYERRRFEKMYGSQQGSKSVDDSYHEYEDLLQSESQPKRTKIVQQSDMYRRFDKNDSRGVGRYREYYAKTGGYEYMHEHVNRAYRRPEEPKKNVKFSEVSGCEERNNIVGNIISAKHVRELEVCFDQVLDKRNLLSKNDSVKGTKKQPKFTWPGGNPLAVKTDNYNKSLPNGHCSSGNGMAASANEKMPIKLAYPTGFLASLKKKKYLSQVIAALAVSLAPFAAGLGKGYSSPAIASLQTLKLRKPYNSSSYLEISVSDQEASWVASLSLLGALFGGIIGGIAMRHGRRKVIMAMSLPFSLSWILTVFAESVEMMFFTSFVGGFCCSVVSMVSQVYVSEISVPDIRGCLNALLKIVGHLGVLMAFTIGAYLDWQQLAMCISIAPLILLCIMMYIPETPSYLVLSGKEEEAYKSLVWLRGPGSDILQELATIRANVLAAKNQSIHTSKYNTLKAFMTRRVASPVLITCGLMLFQRFSGAHAFNFYAVPIFRKTFGGMNPHGGAIAVCFVQLLASCLSGLLIDTVGRLPLLIASSVFMSMALAGFGSYAYYEEVHRTQRLQNIVLNQNINGLGQNDWIPLLCVLVFTVAFSLGMSPISWLLIGELFPLEFRGTGSALATAFSYLCAFIGVKTYIDFQQHLGLHGAFWMYAFISVGGLCFVVCCVPETKGRDLDEMDPKSMQNIGLRQ